MLKIFYFLAPLFFLFSCTKTKSNTKNEMSSRGRFINIAIESPIRSLDPRISNEYPSAHVVRMLFEGLMRLGPDGSIISGIAESYELSDDQKTYTFHLRDSYWSNGEPLTAYDFEYAWKKAVTPGKAQGGAFTFYTILNVSKCLEGKASIEEVGVRSLDSKTLVVDLEHPAPYFLYLTSCPTFAPINKKADIVSHSWAQNAQDCVTNGPFQLKKWKNNECICLEKSLSYWDSSSVTLQGININIIPDATTQFYMFKKGELDWVGDPLATISTDIFSSSILSEQLNHLNSAAVEWLFVNTQTLPLSNVNLRKSLSYAINRQEVVDHILQQGERPALGILGDGIRVNKTSYIKDANIELAKRHFNLALQELNCTLDTLPVLKISCRDQSEKFRVVQAIQQQWSRTLGIKCEIEKTEWPIHFSNMSKGSFQLGEMGWCSWLRDPSYMLGIFRKRSLNMSKWDDEQYSRFLSLADRECELERRRELYALAEQRLMEEMPVIPIHFMTISYLKNKNLEGIYVSSLREIDFRWAYFKDQASD